MFPLATDAVPTTAAGWRDAVAATLAAWVAGPARVTIDGDAPALRAVDVDLSGGRLLDRSPPDVTVVGATSPGPTVGRLHVAAAPVTVRDVAVSVDVTAADARFATGRNAAGQVVVTVAGAADGRLTGHVSAAHLDAALLAAARSAAADHGVDIRSVHATLTARTPRELDVALDVTVKKFVTFPLRVSGRLSVDDTLTATATNLRVDGTGMAAAVAAGILRSQLAKAEGQRVPLMTFNLGDVRLRDVAVDAADGLRVTAKFGGG